MARVVMFDVMGARWLLTNSVNTTRTGELDAADVVAIVGDGDEVSIHKNRGGSALVVDSILKCAILRHWHGEVASELVNTTGAPDAQAQLLAELGRFRDTELKMRAALRARGGETTLQAVERAGTQTHNADLRASYAERERDVLRADLKARDLALAAVDAVLTRAGVETGISLAYRVEKLMEQRDAAKAQRAYEVGESTVAPMEPWEWFEAWASRVQALRIALSEKPPTDGVGIAYSHAPNKAGHRWRAYTGKGEMLDVWRSGVNPRYAAADLEQYFRERVQEQIHARRAELDKLAIAVGR